MPSSLAAPSQCHWSQLLALWFDLVHLGAVPPLAAATARAGTAACSGGTLTFEGLGGRCWLRLTWGHAGRAASAAGQCVFMAHLSGRRACCFWSAWNSSHHTYARKLGNVSPSLHAPPPCMTCIAAWWHLSTELFCGSRHRCHMYRRVACNHRIGDPTCGI